MTLRKASQLAIGLLLAALFLWLAVRHIEPGDIRRALARANSIGIAGALLAVIVGYFLPNRALAIDVGLRQPQTALERFRGSVAGELCSQ